MNLPKGASPPKRAVNENHNSMNVQVNNDGVYTQKEINKNKNNNTRKKIESQKELVIVVAYDHNADTFIN